ncbi:LysE family translocator [Cereibacter ovatus]|nr:LysE family transporter [Cereibacter ovatus]
MSPGPATLMTARTGMTEGLRAGVPLSVGIAVGALTWAAAALSGLALLFELAPALLATLKIGGALYLIWVAVQMWRDADRPFEIGTAPQAPRSAGSAFRRGLFVQYANPKAALFFSAVFVGTIPPDAPGWAIALMLVAIFVNELVWNLIVARVFSFERARSGYISLKSVIDRSFGGLLGALGLKLAAF